MDGLDNPRPRANDIKPHSSPPEHVPGKFEKVATVGQIFASLIPITNGLLVVAHASNGEFAAATNSTLDVMQGLLVVAGMEVIREASKLSDEAIKEANNKTKSILKK